MNVLNIIKELLSEYSDVENITPATKISELEIDSLTYMMALVRLEETLSISIAEDDIIGFETIGDVIEYIRLPWNRIISFHTLRELLEKQAQLHGGERCICDWSVEGAKASITYAQLHRNVLALGSYLYHRGIKDKKIVIVGENSWQWVVAFLAIACGNNTAVPLEASVSSEKLKATVAHSESSLVIYADSLYETVVQADCLKISLPFSQIEKCIADGERLLTEGYCEYLDEQSSPDYISLLPYTSGSTGEQKGVLISQRALVWNVYHGCRNNLVDGNFLTLAPFHHIMGLTVGILMTLASGGNIVINRNIRNMMTDIKQYCPDAILTVPAVIYQILKQVSGMTAEAAGACLGGRLNSIWTGGAPLGSEVRRAGESIGIGFITGYGTTETCPLITLSRETGIKFGSVGRLIDGIQVKINNPNERGIGEVLVKKDWIMDGYYKETKLTEEVIIDGWFHTGDLGYIDEDKYLFLTGRSKNLIILSNGENVSPEYLEELLQKDRAVSECLIYEKNDKITALVYPEQDFLLAEIGDEKIRSYFNRLRSKLNDSLPKYQWINAIEVSAAPLAKSASGKILRKVD